MSSEHAAEPTPPPVEIAKPAEPTPPPVTAAPRSDSAVTVPLTAAAAPVTAASPAAPRSDSAVTVRVTAADVSPHYGRAGRGLLSMEPKEWGIVQFVKDYDRRDVAGKAMLLINTAVYWPTLLLRGMQAIKARQRSRQRVDRRRARPAEVLARQRERMALLRKKKCEAKVLVRQRERTALLRKKTCEAKDAKQSQASSSCSSATTCASAAAAGSSSCSSATTCASAAAATTCASAAAAGADSMLAAAAAGADDEMNGRINEMVWSAMLDDLYDSEDMDEDRESESGMDDTTNCEKELFGDESD